MWINDQKIKQILHHVLDDVENRSLSRYKRNPHTHEERLTGNFLSHLEHGFESFEPELKTWAEDRFKGSCNITIDYEDVAAKKLEKIWGADIGFHLLIEINDFIYSERGLLVQVKKPKLNEKEEETSIPIDRDQLDILTLRSPFALYLFYGKDGLRVLPASSVKDILNSTRRKSIRSDNLSLSRRFPDFFLHDFIANWWGDTNENVLNIIRGSGSVVGVKKLFKIKLSIRESDNICE